MKFGINTLLWTAAFDRSHLHMLPQFREHGFDAVEIARFDFRDFPATDVRRGIENAGLDCVFCSALTGELSLINEDDAVRRRAREFVLEGIQRTAEIGSKIFVGPFCSPVGYLTGWRRTEDEWKRCVDELRELIPTLEQYDVVMAIEPLNRFETYFLNTIFDACRICQEVGSSQLGILGDTFHANIEEKEIGAAFRSAGKWLKHVHTCENDRGIPGSGHVEWPGVVNALREVNYNSYVVIESFGSTIKEIAAAACIWRDLAPSSEAIAYDGLRFLKGAFGIPSAGTIARV
jgi:D-psicose/D-tagatose/L-ribulose 3-epimerase